MDPRNVFCFRLPSLASLNHLLLLWLKFIFSIVFAFLLFIMAVIQVAPLCLNFDAMPQNYGMVVECLSVGGPRNFTVWLFEGKFRSDDLRLWGVLRRRARSPRLAFFGKRLYGFDLNLAQHLDLRVLFGSLQGTHVDLLHNDFHMVHTALRCINVDHERAAELLRTFRAAYCPVLF